MSEEALQGCKSICRGLIVSKGFAVAATAGVWELDRVWREILCAQCQVFASKREWRRRGIIYRDTIIDSIPLRIALISKWAKLSTLLTQDNKIM